MNKTYAIVTLLLVLAIIAPEAMAGEFEGAGVRLCSDFTADYEHDHLTASNFYFNWAEGFMSGANVGRLNDEIAFKSMPVGQQQAFILKFCTANPSEKYFKAVMNLYTAIYPKQKD